MGFEKDPEWNHISHQPFQYTITSLAADTTYLIGPSTASETADQVLSNSISEFTVANQSATADLRVGDAIDKLVATDEYVLVEAGASIDRKGPFGRIAIYNADASAAATFTVFGRLLRMPNVPSAAGRRDGYPSASLQDFTADMTGITADESDLTADQTVLT
jgi:hypothetical protein